MRFMGISCLSYINYEFQIVYLFDITQFLSKNIGLESVICISFVNYYHYCVIFFLSKCQIASVFYFEIELTPKPQKQPQLIMREIVYSLNIVFFILKVFKIIIKIAK